MMASDTSTNVELPLPQLTNAELEYLGFILRQQDEPRWERYLERMDTVMLAERLRGLANVQTHEQPYPHVKVTSGSLQPCSNPRKTNEDRIVVQTFTLESGEYMLAMVMDGEDCVAYAQHELPARIRRELEAIRRTCASWEISLALRRGITAFDEELAKTLKDSVSQVPPEEALSSTFRRKHILKALLRCFRGARMAAVLLRVPTRDLWVANVGDCLVVEGHELGSHLSGDWEVRRLTEEHNTSNSNEVKRIQDVHPGETCIIEDRVLGRTLPTRTLGNWDQKWPTDIVGPLYAFVPFVDTEAPFFRKRLLTNSLSPPYQTALADVTHERLPVGRVVLTLATDGLPDNSARINLDDHPDAENKQEMIESWVRSANRKPLEGLEKLEVTAAERIIRDALGGTDERKVLVNRTDWMRLSIWDDLTVIAVELTFPL